MRIAQVEEIIAGRVRLVWHTSKAAEYNDPRWIASITNNVLFSPSFLRLYQNFQNEEEDNVEAEPVWYHHTTPLLFPVGWARRVGYKLSASNEYKEHCADVLAKDRKV